VKHAREAILGSGEELDDAVFGRLAARMSYVSGEAMDGAPYRRLAAEIGGRQRPLYYLEVPPSLFGPIVEHLASANLLRDGRVAVEKPFGHDLDSARALDARLHRMLSESQILRVDHFLGQGTGHRAGVPAVPDHVTEVRLLLRRTPRLSFLPLPTRAGPNQIVLRIDPDPGMRLELSALASESWHTVHLDASFTRELGEPPGPYERLLRAALAGDHQLFARQDAVEETWRIVQPLLDNPPEVLPYPRGSWGPAEAGSLTRGHPHWQQPWLAVND
jgi:glucose-6-phosphate 1-dehydrogenase